MKKALISELSSIDRNHLRVLTINPPTLLPRDCVETTFLPNAWSKQLQVFLDEPLKQWVHSHPWQEAIAGVLTSKTDFEGHAKALDLVVQMEDYRMTYESSPQFMELEKFADFGSTKVPFWSF